MTNNETDGTPPIGTPLAKTYAAVGARLSLPTEPNARRHAVRVRSGTAVIIGAPILALLLICLFPGIPIAMLFSLLLLMTSIGMLDVTPDAGTEPTPALGGAYRTSLDRLLEGLTRSCREGMTAADRIEMQHQLDMFAQVLAITFGRDPWLVAAEVQNAERRAVPASLLEKGMRLASFREIGREMAQPDGMSMRRLRHHCVNMVPLIAGIGSYFGLDMHRYEAPADDAPGRKPAINGERAGMPDMPMSQVAMLAERWLTGDNSKIDDLLRIETDALAGRDLQQLEQAWIAARLAAPGRHDEIDAKYDAYAEELSRRLEDAIKAREQAAIDDLDTHGRYIESKSTVLR